MEIRGAACQRVTTRRRHLMISTWNTQKRRKGGAGNQREPLLRLDAPVEPGGRDASIGTAETVPSRLGKRREAHAERAHRHTPGVCANHGQR